MASAASTKRCTGETSHPVAQPEHARQACQYHVPGVACGFGKPPLPSVDSQTPSATSVAAPRPSRVASRPSAPTAAEADIPVP